MTRTHRFVCGQALNIWRVTHEFIKSRLMGRPWHHFLTVSDHHFDVSSLPGDAQYHVIAPDPGFRDLLSTPAPCPSPTCLQCPLVIWLTGEARNSHFPTCPFHVTHTALIPVHSPNCFQLSKVFPHFTGTLSFLLEYSWAF